MEPNNDLLTLTAAAKVTPGRPSMFCIWRWCRKGVLARDGRRIRLEHLRVGGRIFTTKQWIDEFGKAVAQADAQHFDKLEEIKQSAPRFRRRRKPRPASEREQYLRALDEKLNAMGL